MIPFNNIMGKIYNEEDLQTFSELCEYLYKNKKRYPLMYIEYADEEIRKIVSERFNNLMI